MSPCYIAAVKMTFKLHAPRTAVEDYRLLYSISDVWKKGGKERDKTNSREQLDSSGLLTISISGFQTNTLQSNLIFKYSLNQSTILAPIEK